DYYCQVWDNIYKYAVF
nr:immunoglobulin light chain junction region [Macaca mulatta]MOV65996.1 immunoglobulin light chain junction region [Macaca mulatta]MOV66003.1 immunoglobulin light chain junction region [Macaca mulatta]MOV66130.1 immunoglobulin light chain junction region [Macaca mulatta]MOV66201.1 immunoglobulin light chain junction region [Macaca mulatta]